MRACRCVYVCVDGGCESRACIKARKLLARPLTHATCSLHVYSKSRICLLGENGNGKTTLLKLIMDQLTPVEGTSEASYACAR